MQTKASKKIIALVGMPGCGKSTVVQILVSEYKLPYVYFGNITLQEVRKRGLEENPQNEQKVRQEIREKYGMGAYAHLSLPEIQKFLGEHDCVLIDGLYSWSEYILLKKACLAEVILLVIISQRKNRYQRLSVRPVRPLTFQQAEERDFAEIERLEKGGPIALCDYYITNDGTIEELKGKIHAIAREIGIVDSDSGQE